MGQYLPIYVLVCSSPSPARSSCRDLGPRTLRRRLYPRLPLPLADVRTDLEPDLNPIFGPIRHGAGQARRHGAPVTDPARAPNCGTFLVGCGLLNHRGQGAEDRLCMPVSAGCACRCSASAMTARSGGTLAAPRWGCLRICALARTGAGPGAGGMPQTRSGVLADRGATPRGARAARLSLRLRASPRARANDSHFLCDVCVGPLTEDALGVGGRGWGGERELRGGV